MQAVGLLYRGSTMVQSRPDFADGFFGSEFDAMRVDKSIKQGIG